MALISVRKCIEYFQQMWREHWSYKWGAAQRGCVDCSGAFCYVWKQFNKSIAHGSNKIARSYIKEMLPVSAAKPGMAAFKKRVPGDEYYDLPDKYKPGGAEYNGDISDYYHIGLVDDDPNYVLNAQNEKNGFQRSPISQKWCGVGYLKDVDYSGSDSKPEPVTPDEPDVPVTPEPIDGGDAEVKTATVIQPEGAGGTYVHFRKTASVSAAVVDDVPFGEAVEVLDSSTNSAWWKIRYKKKTGWMMRKFLELYEESGEGDSGYTPPDSGGDSGFVLVSRAWLEHIRDTLDSYLGVG